MLDLQRLSSFLAGVRAGSIVAAPGVAEIARMRVAHQGHQQLVEILTAQMYKDKRITEGKIQLTLLKRIGEGFLHTVPVEELPRYVKTK